MIWNLVHAQAVNEDGSCRNTPTYRPSCSRRSVARDSERLASQILARGVTIKFEIVFNV